MSKESSHLFGRYRLTKLLGSEGEFIRNYRATQLGLDRDVEIRILSLPGGQSSPFLERFLLETKILAKMDHPSVIPVLDHGTVDGRAYYTTSLRDYVRTNTFLAENGGALATDEFLPFAEILTDALQEMHNNDFLHRNISTNTVFYDRKGKAPYFGECSVMKDIRLSLSTEGLPYLSPLVPTPERLADIEEDERTDIFLISTFFFELMTGRFPFPKSPGLIMKGLPEAIPINTLLPRGKMNDELGKVVMKGLLHDPDLRYQSAEELAEVLRHIARKSQVKPLLQERSFSRAKVRKPRQVVATERYEQRKEFLVYFLAAFFLFLIIMTITLTRGATKLVVEKSPTKAVNLALRDAIITLHEQVKKKKTTRETFDERLKIFRRWLIGNSSKRKPICRYVELTRLQKRMSLKDDSTACQQLDNWIKKARERTISE